MSDENKPQIQNTQLLLVNSFVFQGQFPVNGQTSTMRLKDTKNQFHEMTAINLTNIDYLYADNDEMQIYGIPLKGDQYEFYYAILKKKFQFSQILQSFQNQQSKNSSFSNLKKVKGTVQIPKLKFTKVETFSGILPKAADYNKLVQNLKPTSTLDNVIQQNILDITNSGIKIGSGNLFINNVTIPQKKQSQQPIQLNTPVIFMLKDQKSQEILHYGLVSVLE